MLFNFKTMLKKFQLLLLIFIIFSCKKDSDNPVSDSDLPFYFPPINSELWEKISPESLGWNISGMPALNKLLEENGTRAFILLKNGKIVMEEYFGKNLAGLKPFDQSAYWYWASAGKTLTAFTIGKAQEDGFLKIHDKTSDYLGIGWTSETISQESKITIRNQLTMTTGLDDGIADNHSQDAKDLIYKAEAGSRWAYHNGPYTLLENVISKATNQKFDTYFNSCLANKIGMNGFWQWVENDHVYFSTARSMARFGLLILNKGEWDGTKIMTDSKYFSEMVNTSQQLNKSYGYLWWLNGKESFHIPESQLEFRGSVTPNGPKDMVSGIGKDGQYVSVIPSKGIVMIRLGENPESVQVPFLFLNDIWGKLNLIIN
jgi:CubicO group peptidase (beta-lactamase class C family)